MKIEFEPVEMREQQETHVSADLYGCEWEQCELEDVVQVGG